MRKSPFGRGTLQRILSHNIYSFFCCIVVLFLLTLVESKTASSSEPIVESVRIESNSIQKVGHVVGQLGNSANSNSDNVSVVAKNYGAVLAFTTDTVALGGNAVVSLNDPESNTSISSANVVNLSIKSTTDSLAQPCA